MSSGEKYFKMNTMVKTQVEKHGMSDNAGPTVRDALNSYVTSLEKKYGELGVLNELTERLNNVERFDYDSASPDLCLNYGDTSTVVVEADKEILSIVQTLSSALDISQTQIINYCVFMYIAPPSAELEDPVLRKIQERAIGAQQELNSIEKNFVRVLQDVFNGNSYDRDEILSMLEKRSLEFNDFAFLYKSEFYGSILYKRLTDEYGEDVFTQTEKTINECSEFEIEM